MKGCCWLPWPRLRARAEKAEARATELEGALRALVEDEDEREDGNGPGHAHGVPGTWDAENGPPLGGTACVWCLSWAHARALLGAKEEGGA